MILKNNFGIVGIKKGLINISKQKLLNIRPKDLQSIIQLAYNIGYLKSQKEQNINLSNSWLTKYSQKMNIIKK